MEILIAIFLMETILQSQTSLNVVPGLTGGRLNYDYYFIGFYFTGEITGAPNGVTTAYRIRNSSSPNAARVSNVTAHGGNQNVSASRKRSSDRLSIRARHLADRDAHSASSGPGRSSSE